MQILRELVLEGVVDEIRGEETIVILEIDGKNESRFVKTKELRDKGFQEGQSFYLRFREVQDGSETRTEHSFEPYGDPTIVTRINLWPELDTRRIGRILG